MIKFRNLRADEIEVRPTDLKDGKMTLLLYKDARTDRRILDETIGPDKWNCDFYEVAGNTYCRVGIWSEDLGQWIYKSDTGSEGNFEKEKALASDAFKRACFRWGLGVELYQTPKIRIDCPKEWFLGEKMTMSFQVSKFKAVGEDVKELEITDRFGNVVWPKKARAKSETSVRYTETRDEREYQDDAEDLIDRLKDFCTDLSENGENKTYVRSFYDTYKAAIEDKGFRPRSLNSLWKKWVESPYREEDDKRAREARTRSDNE